ncbi:hypothetical protein BDZ89DRAFT_1108858 [Hymenopellis radicata]|nr:hypothetical protein BDZ89DRAFT_1108858 [Hymenopellis radicata]
MKKRPEPLGLGPPPAGACVRRLASPWPKGLVPSSAMSFGKLTDVSDQARQRKPNRWARLRANASRYPPHVGGTARKRPQGNDPINRFEPWPHGSGPGRQNGLDAQGPEQTRDLVDAPRVRYRTAKLRSSRREDGDETGEVMPTKSTMNAIDVGNVPGPRLENDREGPSAPNIWKGDQRESRKMLETPETVLHPSLLTHSEQGATVNPTPSPPATAGTDWLGLRKDS